MKKTFRTIISTAIMLLMATMTIVGADMEAVGMGATREAAIEDGKRRIAEWLGVSISSETVLTKSSDASGDSSSLEETISSSANAVIPGLEYDEPVLDGALWKVRTYISEKSIPMIEAKAESLEPGLRDIDLGMTGDGSLTYYAIKFQNYTTYAGYTEILRVLTDNRYEPEKFTVSHEELGRRYMKELSRGLEAYRIDTEKKNAAENRKELTQEEKRILSEGAAELMRLENEITDIKTKTDILYASAISEIDAQHRKLMEDIAKISTRPYTPVSREYSMRTISRIEEIRERFTDTKEALRESIQTLMDTYEKNARIISDAIYGRQYKAVEKTSDGVPQAIPLRLRVDEVNKVLGETYEVYVSFARDLYEETNAILRNFRDEASALRNELNTEKYILKSSTGSVSVKLVSTDQDKASWEFIAETEVAGKAVSWPFTVTYTDFTGKKVPSKASVDYNWFLLDWEYTDSLMKASKPPIEVTVWYTYKGNMENNTYTVTVKDLKAETGDRLLADKPYLTSFTMEVGKSGENLNDLSVPNAFGIKDLRPEAKEKDPEDVYIAMPPLPELVYPEIKEYEEPQPEFIKKKVKHSIPQDAALNEVRISAGPVFRPDGTGSAISLGYARVFNDALFANTNVALRVWGMFHMPYDQDEKVSAGGGGIDADFRSWAWENIAFTWGAGIEATNADIAFPLHAGIGIHMDAFQTVPMYFTMDFEAAMHLDWSGAISTWFALKPSMAFCF